MQPAIRIGLEILSALVIGLISSFFVRDPYVDLTIGITSFIMFEVLRIGLKVDNMSRSVETIAEVIKSLQTPIRNNLDSYFNTLLLSQLNRSFQKSEINKIRIPASEGHSFWLRLFPYVEASYQATTFTPYSEGWERGFSDKSMLLHKEKIANGVHITRIFIVKDPTEFQELKRVMQSQKEIGIQVRYIELATLNQLSVTSQNIKKFGTFDYAILDNTHVFKVYLDRNRKWTELELSNDINDLALAKDIYDDIWTEAQMI